MRVEWFILAMYVAFLNAGVSGAPPPPAPSPAPNCPEMCGNVSIPKPFGIGQSCTLPGVDGYFTITCHGDPPRPYIGSILVTNIALETAEMLVEAYTVASVCVNSSRPSGTIRRPMGVSLGAPFLISPDRNVFTAVGCDAVAKLAGRTKETKRYRTGCVTYCASVDEAMKNGEPCMGLGCCEASVMPGLREIEVSWFQPDVSAQLWGYNPCMYAFLAEKDWYHFSRDDLHGTLLNEKKNWRFPLVLDWAINGSCPSEANPDVPHGACVSTHSYCVNASSGQPGYFCKCSQGYTGNPYKIDGCLNINECKLYPSPCKGSTCYDLNGDYECKCNFGRRGEGKSPNGCQAILPLAAVAVIGAIGAISLLAVLLIFIRMEHEKRRLRDRFNRNGGQFLKSLNIEIFTKEKLDQITKNYSTIIGKGAFGQVYKGTNRNMQVAVKRSIAINENRQKESFANEITIQSQISHRNLVRLLGCCLETDVPMLVYEFIPRGSLYDVFHGNNHTTGKNDSTRHPLTLKARLDIAIKSADALAYMHSYASQKILHGDVKSGNILLDDDFVPKVSDFGTSRLLSIEKDHTNFVVGDMGYIDPVYMKTGLLTEKSDVYSFGVVLLELITGKKPRYDGNNSLAINYVKAYMTGTIKEMYDVEIMSTVEDINCLEKVGQIAVRCLRDDVDERPAMTEVVKDLMTIRSDWLKSHGQMNHDQADVICT